MNLTAADDIKSMIFKWRLKNKIQVGKLLHHCCIQPLRLIDQPQSNDENKIFYSLELITVWVFIAWQLQSNQKKLQRIKSFLKAFIDLIIFHYTWRPIFFFIIQSREFSN